MKNQAVRILIIDDNENIHNDFRTVLSRPQDTSQLDALEADLFNLEAPVARQHVFPSYSLDHALQGQEGLDKVTLSVKEDKPFALAFVDIRMPPGLDGVETIERMWKIDPDIQVVICTAFSDYSFEDIINRLGCSDKLLILKKPFDSIEVAQMANAMTQKWSLTKFFKGKEEAMLLTYEARIQRFQDRIKELESLLIKKQ